MEEIEKDLQTIINILKDETSCTDIVIFGSFALGTQNSESDIDIAIRTDKEISKRDIFELSNKLSDILKRDIDLVDLKQIQDGFRYEILINGETIYTKDAINFEYYKLDMYREYLELNESRQDIIRKMKEGKKQMENEAVLINKF